ncbi:MFS transporter [Sphaerisporangium melleum]|uniref:MFS transporter n=1 Tax=Sphaerisporangium melleum TaxID=321316 RepID=A0A917VN74_9ACTN|nr:MFS transporter [Sphaerisporangium melleum]GII73694.1 MFS transporter [Sphaerisporangium melleum]
MAVQGDTRADAHGESGDRRSYTHREILKIMSGLLLALMTSMISTSVVGTALPTVVGEFNAQDQLAWVTGASLLTLTASTPLWGKLSDLFGRKWMFQLSLLVFIAGSILAGMSQSVGMLVFARALQGVGTGGISALTQVILGDVVMPRERGRYSGYIGVVFGVSTVGGPLLGGFIVDAPLLGWRWTFYMCVPFAVAAFAVVQRMLRYEYEARDARIDWWGAFAITGCASAVMVLLSFGGHEFAWNSGWTYALGGAAVLLLAFAVLVERHVAEPILPPRLFRDRTFVLAGGASLLVGLALYGAMTYLPQYFQIVKGMSPTMSGVMTIPLVLSLLLSAVTSGRVVVRTGRWKVFPVAGLLLICAGSALLSLMRPDSSGWMIGFDIALLGTGFGFSMQMLILAAQNAAQRRDMAVATSGVSFFRNLGGAVGVAALGAILTNRVEGEIAAMLAAARLRVPQGAHDLALGTPEAVRELSPALQHVVVESFTHAMQSVFLACVPLAAVGFFAVVYLRELPLRSAGGGTADAG